MNLVVLKEAHYGPHIEETTVNSPLGEQKTENLPEEEAKGDYEYIQ